MCPYVFPNVSYVFNEQVRAANVLFVVKVQMRVAKRVKRKNSAPPNANQTTSQLQRSLLLSIIDIPTH